MAWFHRPTLIRTSSRMARIARVRLVRPDADRPMQAAGDEIFLHHVIGQPQRVPEVRIAARTQELIGKNRHMLLGMGIPHV